MLHELLARQRQWLQSYEPGIRVSEQGTVVSVGDGITWIKGLPSAAMDDILYFADGSQAMVFDLTENLIGAVLLHDTEHLNAGTLVQRWGRTLGIPVGDDLLGRVIDPLGVPLDGASTPACSSWQHLQSKAPPIVARDNVNEPLYTGNKIVDSMVPIGKGQRQLLIGDEGLGRSSIAIDTVIGQRDHDIYCVYVLIGQKRSTAISTIETLRQHGALEYSTVVVAEASSLPGLQHLAPYAGCAVAEYWMHQGRDVLIVYDDLSTHAKTYRELSLLLRRPPGREAYPGDIFSIHAELLERSTCLNTEHGGGSMTALPIVETKMGEIAAYIPTNLISITDGQIYLDRTLFVGGFRPAIDIARSVSRIGGQAQHPLIKREAGRMKLDYLQFLELESFTRFGARLEASMEQAIKKGQLLREILKQDRLELLAPEDHMVWLVAFNDGLFDQFDVDKITMVLKSLFKLNKKATLTLDTPRNQWSDTIKRWLVNLNREQGHDATS